MAAWYIDLGPESDVVISTRIRLARNIKQYPFPVRMKRDIGSKVIEQCKDAILNSNSIISSQFEYIPMSSLSSIDKQALVEKHLISPLMLQDVHSRGVFINNDESISIMINEEDHIRIQCIFSGLQTDKAWDLADKIDDIIEERIEYAYNPEYGYLTTCPTNVGTGMRPSVMMHLPALAITGQLNSLINAVNKLGMAVRGLYGEGTEAAGNIFQISNQVTLGLSEEETLENLLGIVRQIISQERNSRKSLMEQRRIKLEDRLLRSFGVFVNARVMTSDEFMKLLSDVRLGVILGIIQNVKLEDLNTLMVEIQPANIMKLYGENLSPDERDIRRTEIIKERLKMKG